MVSCQDLELLYSAYLDGELDDESSRTVAAHLALCSVCRATVDGLGRVKAAVEQLPSEIEPEHDLWPAIDAAIATECVVPFRHPAPQSRLWRWALPLAAAATLVLVTAVVTSRVVSRQQAPVAASVNVRPDEIRLATVQTTMVTSSFEAARRDLRRAVAARRASLDPTTLREVEANVRIIDEAVSRIEAALARDGGNPGLQRLLLTAYRQELEILKVAAVAPSRG